MRDKRAPVRHGLCRGRRHRSPDSPDDPRAAAAPEEMEVPARPALLTDAEWLEAWAARPVLRLAARQRRAHRGGDHGLPRHPAQRAMCASPWASTPPA
ncbi:MAG: hypothetical protein R2690_17790 [Acidimicrobiales bacterium]